MTLAVIMAGGRGTRFWPMSTPERPKQLIRLFGEKTMIEHTVDRLKPLVGVDQQRIVTVEDQVEALRNRLPDFAPDQFIVEPLARNTAPCIGLSALHATMEDEDAVMIVLPADHRIHEEEAFRDVLKRGIEFVEEHDALVTIGIEPTYPETGYGYIQYEPEPVERRVHRVVTFAEKPNRETAVRFLESGEFLWNSGIFIWRAKRILAEIEEHLPEMYSALMEIQDALEKGDQEQRIHRAYRSIKPISIDYGVMEYTSNAYVVPGAFGWSDVGNWDEVYRISDKDRDRNVCRGPVATLDTSDSYVFSENGNPVAVVGLSDVIVVQTDEGTLVCPRDRVHDVREVVEKLQRRAGKKVE